ncbi:MAG TPA: hypothetical protein VI389_06580 [Geobacteraceae bacterium]
MKLPLLIIVLLLCLAGCSTLKETTPPVPPRPAESPAPPRPDASQELSSALQELGHGKRTAATTILEELVVKPEVKGITDEALFRLSILKLSTTEKDGAASSIRYLERLRKEYPDSRWALQAKPLLDYLYAVADMSSQNRNLKAHNSSLAKENKELHKSIKRLKTLDLQMERNVR